MKNLISEKLNKQPPGEIYLKQHKLDSKVDNIELAEQHWNEKDLNKVRSLGEGSWGTVCFFKRFFSQPLFNIPQNKKSKTRQIQKH